MQVFWSKQNFIIEEISYMFHLPFCVCVLLQVIPTINRYFEGII